MRSGFERTLAAQLDAAKVAFKYEPLSLPYVMHHSYKFDFLILKNGIAIEAKGLLNRYDKDECSKLNAFREQHPELDLRLVFMDAEQKVAGKKMTHAQWATRYKWKWASERIPEEWLK